MKPERLAGMRCGCVAALVVGIVAVAASGCEDDFMRPGSKPTTAGAGARPAKDAVDLTGLQDLDVAFELTAAGAPFDCSSSAVAMGAPAVPVRLEDARIYISDVHVLDANGAQLKTVLKPDDTYQQARVALLDFEDGTGGCEFGDAATNTVLHLAVAPGTYQGLSFRVGVPEALEHSNPVVAWPPLNVVALHWSWLEGYRFIRIELVREGDHPVSVHLGSGKCIEGAANAIKCDAENRAAVTLQAFDPNSQIVALDLTALMSGSVLDSVAPDCIVGPNNEECAPVLQRLGIDPNTGVADPARQSVFSARAK